MKICITSYFGLRESLLAAADMLTEVGHQVIDYPLFAKNINLDTKISDIIEDFSNFIETERPDGILWWCLAISTDDFIKLKQVNCIKYWYFNWDEPYNWINCELEKKAPYFDCVFISCLETVKNYLNCGTRQAVYCLPGYDSEIFYPIENVEYKYDISIVLTNLYGDSTKYPDQIVNRNQLIDDIYNELPKHGYKLSIFGPELLKNIYPDAYIGYCHYSKLNSIFNASKINLTTHVVGNKEGYLNERTVTLIGSGSLILIDPIKGLDLHLQSEKNCLYLNLDDPIGQIVDILSNYENSKYNAIKNDLKSARKYHSWQQWAQKIHCHIT